MTQYNQLSQSALNNVSPHSLTPLHDLVSASRLNIDPANFAHISPKPVHWLWQQRIPLAGITLLDGDHGCGKSLLALQIAAAVSSGSSMPDGSPTLQGGVVIITPHIDPTSTQLQLLTALGANLQHIQILSFILDPSADSSLNSPAPHNSDEFNIAYSHPFSLPEDSHALFQAIQRVNARLVIFDPFISLLSRTSRTTNDRLCHLLADLNRRFIAQNIACLLIRNCHARGGHSRPSTLERSDHFITTSSSHLLLARDPFFPNRLLLCHASNRHAALTPTLILQVQPSSHNSDLPHLAFLGSHTLHALDFIEHRPDTLHRQILSQHLLTLINNIADKFTSSEDVPDPNDYFPPSESVPVSTLYAHSPHSSPFQIQRSLNDLLNMGQIQRLSRGVYSSASNPISTFNATAATTPLSANALVEYQTQATITDPPDNHEDWTCPCPSALDDPFNDCWYSACPNPGARANPFAHTEVTPASPVLTDEPPMTFQPLSPQLVEASTSYNFPTPELNSTAATTPPDELSNQLNSTAATTFIPDHHLSPADAALYNQFLEKNWRMTYMDYPPRELFLQRLQDRNSFWHMDHDHSYF